jgi:hypothetical protein
MSQSQLERQLRPETAARTTGRGKHLVSSFHLRIRGVLDLKPRRGAPIALVGAVYFATMPSLGRARGCPPTITAGNRFNEALAFTDDSQARPPTC